MARLLRGGGDKILATKKKEKTSQKIVATKLEGGVALVATPLKKITFLRLPFARLGSKNKRLMSL